MVDEVLCLNRIFRYCPATATSLPALEIEADPRRAEILIAQAGLTMKSKALVAPGAKPKDTYLGTVLSRQQASLYRSRAMRGSYFAEDRPDIRYACREAARLMKEPTTVAETMLKHLAR